LFFSFLVVEKLRMLQPFLKPILQSATGGLSTVSGEVIDTHDQYEVFDDSRAVRLLEYLDESKY